MVRLGFALLILLTGIAQAQSDSPASSLPDDEPLTQLGSEFHNSIQLLSNRFRIDYEVDEVTMVFFRDYGSAPVVLVRPDGSKLFQIHADGDRVAWFDSNTYDMVSIKNPVPGPWQAVGQILPGSRVMVLSDVELHAEPLPPIIFSGEILKQTARLTNGGEAIDYGPFRDVVKLNIELVSTNNPNFDNFGSQAMEIASFEDNGRGMDERPLDGIFTGQFNLTIPAGEWKPVFRVITPMFTREQIDPVIQLYPTPVFIDVVHHGGGENYHLMTIDTDRELVDINSLLIDGKVRFPNGDIQNFSLTETNDQVREHMIVAIEGGVFRVKLTAYGKTVNGRDFILDVPEYSFLVKNTSPKPDNSEVGSEAEVGGANQPAGQVSAQDSGSADDISGQENDGEPTSVLSLILLVNGILMGVGILVIAVLLWRKNGAPKFLSKIKFSLPRKQKSASTD